MMDCVLLRHGIAVERDEWEGKDADRPLTERGAKRVAQVAAGLNRLDVQPTACLVESLDPGDRDGEDCAQLAASPLCGADRR